MSEELLYVLNSSLYYSWVTTIKMTIICWLEENISYIVELSHAMSVNRWWKRHSEWLITTILYVQSPAYIIKHSNVQRFDSLQISNEMFNSTHTHNVILIHVSLFIFFANKPYANKNQIYYVPFWDLLFFCSQIISM